MPTTRAALELHLALFRRQKAEISAALKGARSPALVAYEKRYERHTRRIGARVSVEGLQHKVAASDVVYVGDYHTLPAAQHAYLNVVDLARRGDRRRTVLAMEFLDGRHQPLVDRYLARELTPDAFFAAIDREDSAWDPFKRILGYARKHRLAVIALDAPPRGEDPLHARDVYAAKRISRELAAEDRPRVLVLTGQFHVAPCHLPAEVKKRSPEASGLVVYQNCDRAFWELAQRGRGELPFGVELADGSVCLFTASPVVAQQSFLDHLESAGDFPIEHDAAAETFAVLARGIAHEVGINATRELGDLEVATAAEPDFLDRLRQRSRFGPVQLEQVRRHVLDRQSCYWPRAKMAYLASLSLDHAAEEAAHFIRHLCVGDEMVAPRRASDAFYARCLEEALGFLGSKLVHPKRRCPTVSDYADAFENDTGENHAIAAFVLAHKAAERDGADEATRMIPLRKDRLFHAVSHGLGYLLGDAWFRAWDEGKLSRAQLRRLFRDPFRDPRGAYFAHVEALRACLGAS